LTRPYKRRPQFHGTTHPPGPGTLRLLPDDERAGLVHVAPHLHGQRGGRLELGPCRAASRRNPPPRETPYRSRSSRSQRVGLHGPLPPAEGRVRADRDGGGPALRLMPFLVEGGPAQPAYTPSAGDRGVRGAFSRLAVGKPQRARPRWWTADDDPPPPGAGRAQVHGARRRYPRRPAAP